MTEPGGKLPTTTYTEESFGMKEKIIEKIISAMNSYKETGKNLAELNDEYRRGQGRGMIDTANIVLRIIDLYDPDELTLIVGTNEAKNEHSTRSCPGSGQSEGGEVSFPSAGDGVRSGPMKRANEQGERERFRQELMQFATRQEERVAAVPESQRYEPRPLVREFSPPRDGSGSGPRND